MDYIDLGNTYTIANIDVTWVDLIDINNNNANVKLGNSDVILNIEIPITHQNDVANAIMHYVIYNNEGQT
jgi:hypothetical protein